MFGRKKKKKEEEAQYTASGVKKIKLSELPPEEQERVLAQLRKIGDDLTERYERIMKERLERAKAGLQNNQNDDNQDNIGGKEG